MQHGTVPTTEPVIYLDPFDLNELPDFDPDNPELGAVVHGSTAAERPAIITNLEPLEATDVVVIDNQVDALISEVFELRQKMHRLMVEAKNVSARALRMLKDDKVTMRDGQQADMGYLFRRMELDLDEMRKDCGSKAKLVGKILGLKLAEQDLHSGKVETSVRGVIATATPNTTPNVKTPRRKDDAYPEFAKQFGVEPSNAKLFSVHYPTLCDMVGQMMAEGKQLPDHIEVDSYTYSCTYSARRGKGSK